MSLERRHAMLQSKLIIEILLALRSQVQYCCELRSCLNPRIIIMVRPSRHCAHQRRVAFIRISI